MDWNDYKFRPTEVPTTAPTESSSGPGFQFGDMLNFFRNGGFGSSNPMFERPQSSNPWSMLTSGPFRMMFSGIDNPQSAAERRDPIGYRNRNQQQQGPMLSDYLDYWRSQQQAPVGPEPLSQAERIKELTSMLSNKKLGT